MDGKKQEVKALGFFMGVSLTEGEHEIVWSYTLQDYILNAHFYFVSFLVVFLWEKA